MNAHARQRILIVLGTSSGGVGRHVQSVTRGLIERGRAVVVAGPQQTLDGFGPDGLAPGARRYVVAIHDRPNPASDVASVLRLATAMRGADVVHAHGVRAGALAVLAGRTLLRGRPRIVVTVHNAPPEDGRLARIYEVLERIVARGSDAVLVVSGDLGDRARRLGARRVERALVPTPQLAAPAPDASRIRRELGLRDGALLLMTVARLAPQKGLHVLLDAIAELVRRRPDVLMRSAIAGDGPLEAELAARIGAEQLPVELLGRRSDVADLFAAADVVVLPSLWEGQPLVAQEALRAGTALVATDVGGTAEVTADAAVLVPGGDAGALADALAGLIDYPDRLADLRRRARARAARLPSDDEVVAQLLAVYGAGR